MIFILGVACLALFILAGCARKKREGVLTFSVGGAPKEVEFWETLVGDFARESGIKAEILRQPTDTDQRRQGLVISLKAGKNDPDVFLMDVAWIAQFAASGWLEPIDEYATQDNYKKDVFFSRVVELADRFDGKTIALPVYVDGGLLYYRKDLLERFGFKRAPETWEELVEYSLKIQEEIRQINPDFYGFVWQGAQYEGLVCNFVEFAGSNGGGIILNGEKIEVDTPQNVEAVQFMCDLMNKYKISPPSTFTEMKEEEVRSFFELGNALFERNWPYAWLLHASMDSAVKDKVGIAPLPHFSSGRSVSALGGWHIGISRYSDAKKSSWEFVKFVTSFEIQKRLALNLGWNPGRKDVYIDSEVLKKMPHLENLRDVFENALPRPNLPYYTQVSEVLQRYLNAALAGELSPEPALMKAEEEIRKLIERYI